MTCPFCGRGSRHFSPDGLRAHRTAGECIAALKAALAEQEALLNSAARVLRTASAEARYRAARELASR